MQVLMAFIECLTSIKSQCKLLSEREREGGKVEGEKCVEGRERAAILVSFWHTFFLLFAIVVVASPACVVVVVVVIFCTLPQNSLMIKNVYILRTAQAAGHR